jgi:hypothetical protein
MKRACGDFQLCCKLVPVVSLKKKDRAAGAARITEQRGSTSNTGDQIGRLTAALSEKHARHHAGLCHGHNDDAAFT